MGIIPSAEKHDRASFYFLDEFQEEFDPTVKPGDICLATLLYSPPSGKGIVVAGSPLRDLPLDVETVTLMSDLKTLIATFVWGNSQLGKALKLCLADPGRLAGTILTFTIPNQRKNPEMGESTLTRAYWDFCFDYDRPSISVGIVEEVKQVIKTSRKVAKDFEGSLVKGD